MAYVDGLAWSPEHVAAWLCGVHSSLRSVNMEPIVKSKITGAKLLMMAAEDITKLLPIDVDATEAILQGISLLRYLHFESSGETLQSLILKLACRARCLYNHLIQAEFSPRLFPFSSTLTTPMTSSLVHSATGDQSTCFDFTKVDSNMQINATKVGQQRVSIETLESVSDIAEIIKYMINWLNNYRFADSKLNSEIKSIIIRLAVELTSTAQRDQFVEYPNDILKKTSKFLADYCDYIVLALVDADYIQSCRLDIVSVKKKLDEHDFGLVIHSPAFWSHSVEEVVFSSAAHKSGGITRGDELIQIDYQTIVGWATESVLELLNSYPTEVILTIRKKPYQDSQSTCVNTVVSKPFPIPLKRLPSQRSKSKNGTTRAPDTTTTTSDKPKKDLTEKTEFCSAATQALQAGEDAKNPSSDLTVDESLKSAHASEEDDVAAMQALLRNDQVESSDQNLSEAQGANNQIEAPKEPKGPVYEIKATKSRRELRRRASISGSISDALVDLALGDALPIPTGDGKVLLQQNSETNASSAAQVAAKAIKISKESLTKSVSHDTAKLYLHTLSIDKKHLW